MADWGARAKDKDRDDAIRMINDAAARGQIIGADRDKRIQEVRSASTVGEIELITRGLAASAGAVTSGVPGAPPSEPTFTPYTPPTTPPVTEPSPPAPTPPAGPLPPVDVSYGGPHYDTGGTSFTASTGGKSHAGKLGLIITLCLVAGVAVPIIFGIRALIDSVGDLDDIISDGKADVFSDSGYAEMLEDIEEATGSTEAFSLVMYPDYASLELPTQAQGKRYISYRYGGTLDEFSKGTVTEDVRFDLSDLKPRVLRDLTAEARTLVEGPINSYVIVRPGVIDQKVRINAYASNDFGESGYVVAQLNGRIIERHPPS